LFRNYVEKGGDNSVAVSSLRLSARELRPAESYIPSIQKREAIPAYSAIVILWITPKHGHPLTQSIREKENKDR
jgi:hypothetical protein